MIEWDMRELSESTVGYMQGMINEEVNPTYYNNINTFLNFVFEDFEKNNVISSYKLRDALDFLFKGNGDNTSWHRVYYLGDIFISALSEYKYNVDQDVVDFFKKIIIKYEAHTAGSKRSAENGWKVIQSAKIEHMGRYEKGAYFTQIKEWLDRKKKRLEEIQKDYVKITGGLTV